MPNTDESNNENNGSDRIEQIQILINAFKMERVIYIILTTISAISLIGLGLYLALNKGDSQTFLALLAPTGTLTLCIFRVLKMWDDALKFITNPNFNDNDSK
jgi:hypothetical protein